MGTMPSSAIGVERRIGDLSQSSMDLPQFSRASYPVSRRPHQRVSEPDPCADLKQPLGLRRGRCLGSDSKSLGGAPQQGGVAGRLHRGHEQQPSGFNRKRPESTDVALFDAAGQRRGVRQSESACRFSRGQPTRQL